jgi:four helix bundle protein
MATIKKFEDLEIWQMSFAMYKSVFQMCKSGDISKDFELRNQMRASAGSVPDNIAEGFERGGNREFFQFLSIAKGSAGELRSQIHRCLAVEYITEEQHKELILKSETISQKISNFMKYLNGSDIKGYKYKKVSEEENIKPQTSNLKQEI